MRRLCAGVFDVRILFCSLITKLWLHSREQSCCSAPRVVWERDIACSRCSLLSVAEVLHSLYSATPVAMATLVGTCVCFVLQFNWPNFVNTVWYAGLLVVHCLVESVLAVLLARPGKCSKLSLMLPVMS